MKNAMKTLSILIFGLTLTAGGCNLTDCQQRMLDQHQRGLIKGEVSIQCEIPHNQQPQIQPFFL